MRKSVRERIDLSLFDDLRMVYAVRLQTKRQQFRTTLVGHSVPTFCCSGGWAVLSALPDERVRDIIERSDRRPFTTESLTEMDDILAQVQQARDQGFAIACSQILSGEIAAALPILNNKGEPIAAIHIAGSLAEWTVEEFVQSVVPLGQEAARAISQY